MLLAAGLSRRYGGNKLLAQVEGEALYRRAFAALPARLFSRAAVVSGCGEILTAAEELGYLAVPNRDGAAGQSLSLRLGLAAVEEGAQGVLFAVCDQPWLRRESVERLLRAWEEAPEEIAALSWRGRRGNPVIFPAWTFPELKRLTGDVGGAAALRAHPDRVRLVEAEEERELRDVDRREDRE